MSFEDSVRRQKGLMSFARKLTKDKEDAQDLVQDTLLKAYAAWESFVPRPDLSYDVAFGRWACAIMYNQWLDNTHKQSRRARIEHDQAAQTIPTTSRDELHTKHDVDLSPKVQAALETLPAGQREVVRRVLLGEDLYKDAAASLGVPIGTVMSSLWRARRRLSVALCSFARTEYGLEADLPAGEKPRRRERAVTDQDRVNAAMAMDLEMPL